MKTAAGLIEFCLSKIGCFYWFGCYGQKATEQLYKEKKRVYPKYYTANDYLNQLGGQVFDCSGLIKSYLWTNDGVLKYDAKTDYSANALYNMSTKKGTIDSFDRVNGRLLFKGSEANKSHVGVYYNGTVIEAKNHANGVIQSKFNDSWKYWGASNLISYEEETADPVIDPSNEKGGDFVDIRLSVVQFGSKGEEVKTIQRLLNSFGFRDPNGAFLDVDGDAGHNTIYAIKRFQTDYRGKNGERLTPDGIVGLQTWNALLK